MLVISDTSPLTALLLTRKETLLRQIFDRVVIYISIKTSRRSLMITYLSTLMKMSFLLKKL
jgi:hypothetical protein